MISIGTLRPGLAVSGQTPHIEFQHDATSTPENIERLNMRRSSTLLAALAIAAGYAVSSPVGAENAQMARGRYLVQFGGCTDCHTPGHLLGKPDMSRFLGGSDVGFEVPGLGVFVAPNLTPDKDTGLGSWTKDEVTTAIQTGVGPDGMMITPRAQGFCNASQGRALGLRRSGVAETS